MAAGRSDFEGAFDVVLAFDFVKIHFVGSVGIEKRATVEMEWRDFDFSNEKIPGFFQVAYRKYLDAVDHGGLPLPQQL